MLSVKCTTSFLSVPSAVHGRKEPSTSTIIPQASPQEQSKPLSIVPQDTGEWTNPLSSFRQGLLRGKSLNRFSGFVTSGAEEWVLEGCVDPVAPNLSSSHQRISTEDSINDDNRLSRLGLGEADRHYIDAGPTWQSKVPKFRVLVHSPSKRTSGLSGAYTVYSVTSLFSSTTDESYDPYIPPISPTRITVQRRFSHFIMLHTSLTRRLPGIALPPLPEKQYAGRFNADFVEARRGELERYIGSIVRHPVARYAEVVTSFLGCESDVVSVNDGVALLSNPYSRNGNG
jgi:sorting nexin-9/18/33